MSATAKHTENRRAVRVTIRVAIGLVATAAVGATVFAAQAVTLPGVALPVTGMGVDTTQSSARTLVCPGAVVDLGANPDDPSAALPVGSARITSQGSVPEATLLQRDGEEGADSTASAYSVSGDDRWELGLSQTQEADTDSLDGLTGVACDEPQNEVWLVGGDTTVGNSTTLSVQNPGGVTANVAIRVFGQDGLAETLQSEGIIVPPGSSKTVSLNGYAPNQTLLATQLVSRGASITASLQQATVVGLSGAGLDQANGQLPSTELIIPGVINPRGKGIEAVDAHGHSNAASAVRVLAPGSQKGTVTVTGIDSQGNRTVGAQEELTPGKVQVIELEEIGDKHTTLEIAATVPVVAGALGTAVTASERDFAWFTPAPALTGTVPVTIASGPNPRLVLAAPKSDQEVTVTLTPSAGGNADPGEERTVTIPAGASVSIKAEAGEGYLLSATAEVFAAVNFSATGKVTGYPVLQPVEQPQQLEVYAR